MQRKLPDNFPIFVGVALLAVFFLGKTVFDNLFYAAFVRWLSEQFGVQEAQVIAGLSSVLMPLVAIILIVIGVAWYVRREVLKLHENPIQSDMTTGDRGELFELRDKLAEAKTEIVRLEAIAPDLVAEINGIYFGGTLHSDRRVTASNLAPIFLVVAVANVGNMQSIAKQFRITLVLNGVTKVARNMALADTITFQIAGDENPVTYGKDDALFMKASTPIQVGAETTGILFGVLDISDKDFIAPGAEVTVSFVDVFGKDYATSRVI